MSMIVQPDLTNLILWLIIFALIFFATKISLRTLALLASFGFLVLVVSWMSYARVQAPLTPF